ncbi:MAG: beta-L-arabinofuranosidase domain-containing protein [Anaerolineae bacterium]
MRTYAEFQELPITAITPEGWLRRYLEVQRDGLTGHLEVAGFPFDTPGWAAPLVTHRSGSGWWPYEQTGYWFDGMIRCGHLLGDRTLIDRARDQIRYVLEHADDDGYLGPAFMKDPIGANRWPHAIFFRAWMADYDATGDPRLVDALRRHYLSGDPDTHADQRNVCNVEAMLWTYAQSGDEALLQRAVATYETYNERWTGMDTTLTSLLSDRQASEHGVTYNEIAKLGAILYAYTGQHHYLEATIRGYRKIDRDHMLVDGVCSSTEQLRAKDPLESHETCDIADYTWGVGYLLLATGEAEYADSIERACFNAGPGAVRSDFRGLQYFSCPNQVIADARSNHNLFYRGTSWMSYRPNPGTECCPGQINRVMPNFAARMWLRDGEGGLVAALYGPSRVTAPAGSDRKPVTIVEDTTYPFSDRIQFEIETQEPTPFTLYLRIPQWCTGAALQVNGEAVETSLLPGTFVPVMRTWEDGDTVTLQLPMSISLRRWPHNGISIERGPLVYALRVEEDWRVDEDDPRSTPDFPAWNLYPASPWNYALALHERHLQEEVEVIERPMTAEPWSIDTAPIELRVPAHRVRDWDLDRRSTIIQEVWARGGLVQREVEGEYVFTPQLPDPDTLTTNVSEKKELVTLVPYGCTKLRITIFPDVRRLLRES